MAISYRESVASELRAEIARQRLSLTELAERTDMITSTLTRKIRAQYPFTTDELVEITAALGITMVDLFTRAEQNVRETVR